MRRRRKGGIESDREKGEGERVRLLGPVDQRAVVCCIIVHGYFS